MFAGFVQALFLASLLDSGTIPAIPKHPITSRQEWVEWTLREWWLVKLCAAFAAFFGVLRVSREEVTEKILAGKKFGLFKPHTMKWKEELRGELVDSVAYVSGSLFTRSLLKHGEEN